MTQTKPQTRGRTQAQTQTQTHPTVRAVNHLTTRWAAQAVSGAGGTVFTAAGVWPLLALLADGAGGPARDELAQALGIPAEDAAGAARELLAALAGVRGLSTATGLWAAAGLPLEEGWSAKLPHGTRGTLTGDLEGDTKTLDGWASDRTGGLIERMPVTLQHDTRLVLASALALTLKWAEPFREFPGHVPDGPWAGRGLRRLLRTTASLDPVRVAEGPAGPVTALEVTGADDTDMDVHLLLGGPAAGGGARPAVGVGPGSSAARRRGPPTCWRPASRPSPEPSLRWPATPSRTEAPGPASRSRRWTPSAHSPSCPYPRWPSRCSRSTTCWRTRRCSGS
ncbi:serpin family protein [Streptomyces erythrochromogenes]|uniref:serpin family protein n=1 Tax=Streptomyces erythrochromogenes TaxID=285574 RepID=UPI0036D0BED6